jgi:hypothetical protein
MPLADAFEIIPAEVRNCRIFAVFATLNPLKLQPRRSYFPSGDPNALESTHLPSHRKVEARSWHAWHRHMSL